MPAGTRIKVPVAEIMAEAYRGVFGQLNLLLEIAWLPLLLLLAAAIIPGYLAYYRGAFAVPHWLGDRFGVTIDDLIEALVGLLCLSAFAVRWYQATLFAGARSPPSGMFARAWLRFLLYTLLLYLVAAALLLGAVFVDIDGVPDYVAFFAGMALMAAWLAPIRCMLVFPAAATGKSLSIAAAWRILGGNTWRLFACLMLVTVPIVFAVAMVISGLLTGLHLENLGNQPPPVGFFILRGVLSCCGNLFVVALSAAAIAGFYRRLPGAGL